MVSYNAIGLDLSGITGAIDAIGRRRLQEQERQRLEQEKLQSAQEVGAFGDRLLGTIATSGGSGGGAPSRGAELMGIGGNYASAIKGIESGGRYDALGPMLTQGSYAGDRAYGAYQVMGKNIPQWTKEVLGREMTPQEFLANKEAQDKVFEVKFGQSVAKYGTPQDAASVWFTGRPAAQGAGARDTLGTTGAQYVAKFNAGLGHKAPAPVTQEAGTQQIATASLSDRDWRTAQASPEEFERQLVAARTGVASPVKRIAPTVGSDTGGVSAPAVNVAGRMPAVPAGVGQGEITPERVEMLRQGLQSRNPAVQQMAIQEINRIREAQSKGPDYESVAPGATLYDKRSGRAIYTAPKDGAGVKWELKELKDGRVVLHNPVTNEVKPAPIEGATGKARPNFEVEDKLRDDYEKKLKPFEELQDAYGSVRAAVQGRIEAPDVQSPASDMALIFAYMKMLDPSSVVREGEYDKVGNTTNIPGKVLNYLNRARTGEMLNDDQIEDIVKSAHRRYEQKYKDTEKIADRFRQLAPHYGIDDPNRIVFLPERAEMPQIPRRGAGGGQKRDANQYGVVPTQRAWTNPDGSAPVFKSGQYTVERYNP